VLKAGHNQVPDYPHGRIIHDFAKRVGELSNGRIKVEVFDNGTLGQEDQLFEGMRLGSIDMGKSITSEIGTTVPSFQVFDLPYIFRDSEHMWNVLNGDIGKQMLKELETEAGVKGLFWMDQGTRNFYTVDKPIRSPKDLEGLKIRSIQSPIMVDTINAFGGAATAMPFGELYTAFKTKAIDGAENAPDTLWYSKQHEVVKYYSETEHFRTPVLFMISMKTWNKLSPEDQKIILEAGKQASEAGKDLYEKEAAGLLKEMEKSGLDVITDVDKKSFEKLAKPIHEKFRDKIGGDLIDKILAQ
jgi:tripartite ATP-independent transporter DctP family solute receptor